MIVALSILRPARRVDNLGQLARMGFKRCTLVLASFRSLSLQISLTAWLVPWLVCVCCLSCCFCWVGFWFLFFWGKFDLNHRAHSSC